MEQSTKYKNWVVEEDQYYRYLRIKPEDYKTLDLYEGETLWFHYPHIYKSNHQLVATIAKRDDYEFESLKDQIKSVKVSQAILNHKKEAVSYYLQFRVDNQQALEDTFFPKAKKLVTVYGKEAKFSWFKIIYYGLVLILATIMFVLSIIYQVGFLITLFLGIVILSVIYLAMDYASELKKNGKLKEREK